MIAVFSQFALSLEVIPRLLSENAGFDSTDILNSLRAAHATKDFKWAGVDIENGDICDTFKVCPAHVAVFVCMVDVCCPLI